MLEDIIKGTEVVNTMQLTYDSSHLFDLWPAWPQHSGILETGKVVHWKETLWVSFGN